MNKKLFFGLAATFAVAVAVVCVTVSSVNGAPKISNLMIKNLEILTKTEYDSTQCQSSSAGFDFIHNWCLTAGGDYVYRPIRRIEDFFCWPGHYSIECFSGKIIIEISCDGVYNSPVIEGGNEQC